MGFPKGGPPPGGGSGNMMRDMQGLMGPGGMKPDELGAGGGVDVQGLIDQITQAPPEVLQILKQVIDEQLAATSGGEGEALPPEQM